MNKKIVLLCLFAGLMGLAGFALAAPVVIPNPLQGVNNFCELLTKIASGVGMFIASLGTIMIIVAGILYLTSAGSTERMTKAKTALVYAIAGLVIGISATAIVEIIKSILNASGASCK